jgi:hypothetical protein
MSTTWTDAGTTYNAIKFNVTDTASNAASLLMDLQVGGASRFSVRKDGLVFAPTIGGDGGGFLAGGTTITSAFAYIGQYGARLSDTRTLSWSSGTNLNSLDLVLARDAANTLAQRNSTNAQTFRLYNTYTDASNYERADFTWVSNVARWQSAAAGSGTVRNMEIVRGSTTHWLFNSGGNTFGAHLLAGIDNTYDIGASGASRPRTIYAGADIFCGGQMGPTGSRLWGNGVTTTGYVGFASSNPLAPDTTLTRVAAGIVGVRDSTTGGAAVSLVEQTAPAAPAANGVYIYAEDDGAGKTRLMARFATGAAVQIAIEP